MDVHDVHAEKAVPPKKRRRLQLSLSKSMEAKHYTCNEDNDSPHLDGARKTGDNEDGPCETSENEAYFSANFKSVCNSVFAEDSRERHIFTESDTDVVMLFMALPSKPNTHSATIYTS